MALAIDTKRQVLAAPVLEFALQRSDAGDGLVVCVFQLLRLAGGAAELLRHARRPGPVENGERCGLDVLPWQLAPGVGGDELTREGVEVNAGVAGILGEHRPILVVR